MFRERTKPHGLVDGIITTLAGIGLGFFYIVIPIVFLSVASYMLNIASVINIGLIILSIFIIDGIIFYAFSFKGVSITDTQITFYRRIAKDIVITKKSIKNISLASTAQVIFIGWFLFREMTCAHTVKNHFRIEFNSGKVLLFPPDDFEGFITILKEKSYSNLLKLENNKFNPP